MARLTRRLSPSADRTPPARPALRMEALERRDAPAIFTNSNPITIVDNSAANPFPSAITVSGLGTSIQHMTVTLTGYSHTISYDADILLVGPQGQKVMLMSDVGSSASNVTLTFADGSPSLPANQGGSITSGTYSPRNNGGNIFGGHADDFAGRGGPAGPYGSALSDFTGTDPNGTWSLFIIDEIVTDSGSISGGWSLDINTPRVTSVSRVGAANTNASTVDFTVVFNQSVTGVDASDFAVTTTGTLAGASVTGVSGSGDTYTVTVNTGSGDGTLRLDVTDDDTVVNAVSDPLGGANAGNGNFTAGQSYALDRTAPTVTGITRVNASPTTAGSVQFTVVFSESVTGVGAGDFAVTTTGTLAGASVTGVAGSGDTYTVTVNTGSGDGTLRLDVLAGGITDAGGNTNAGYTAGPAYLLDRTAPAAPVVTGPAAAVRVNANTFAVTGTAEADALVRVYSDANNNGLIDGGDTQVGSQQLTGGATAFSIPVALGQDQANNFLVRADDALGNASAHADVPTITEDSTLSGIVSVVPPAAGVYNAGRHLDWQVTFDEPVFVTGAPRIALNVGVGIVYAEYAAGSGTHTLWFRYTVRAGDTDTDGVEIAGTIDLNGGAVADAAGNNAGTALPAPAAAVAKVDTTPPTVALTSPRPAATNASPIPVTVTFSEATKLFTADDLTPTNATVANFTPVSDAVYTFDLIPLADGDVTVAVGPNAGSDAGANWNATGASLTRTADGTRPTAAVALAAGQPDVTGRGPVRFTVTFSEPVTGFTAAAVTVGGTAAGGAAVVTGSGTTYEVTVDGFTRGGTVTLAVNAGVAADAVGNVGPAAAGPAVRLTAEPTSVFTAVPRAGDAGTRLRITDPAAGGSRTVTPFPNFFGQVVVAAADVTGDGFDDYIVGAGATGGPHVKVFDGQTGAELRNFFAFDPAFTGGVSVAAGDVTGDGFTDLIVAAGATGGPHVKVFDGASGGLVTEFMAYHPAFRGGVRVAAGDVDGDGRAEVVTAPGAGGGPHVRVFAGATGGLVNEFMAYHPTFAGGVSVAVGDLTGDGLADIVTGAGAGGGPHVKAFAGASFALLHSFFAYDPTFAGGVNVAATDVTGDGRADIVTGAGAGGGPHVRAFSGLNLAVVQDFMSEDLSFTGGVNVG